MKFMGKFLIVMVILWIGTLIMFVSYVILCDHSYDRAFDNIVVLTGGPHRIAYAFQLIGSSKPKNVFISGVYEKTMLKDIGPEKGNENVKIVLGKQAKNTRENALEIDEWGRQNNISEILLVTSDYHIPRSVIELRSINDSLQIYPCGVESNFSVGFMRQCIKELHKIMYVYIRNFIKK